MEALRAADPRQVGPYTLEARLGGGGMGQVFLGRSRGGRRVAVKVVRPDLADDPEFRRRFAAEITAARRVGGFHTAQVVDAAPDADPPWMATAYIPGPSLHQAIRDGGPLPAPALGELAAGLAEGLLAVHACDLVHRDLKPGNVILAEDGPRLIDFGIARALDATSATRTHAVLGTPAYMSPEQARGLRVGPESDVFALGAVLAFAGTGRAPFGTGHPDALVYRIVHAEPELSGLASHLVPLVTACLAKDPGDRPDLAHVLDRVAGPAPTAVAPVPSTPAAVAPVPSAPAPVAPVPPAAAPERDVSESRPSTPGSHPDAAGSSSVDGASAATTPVPASVRTVPASAGGRAGVEATAAAVFRSPRRKPVDWWLRGFGVKLLWAAAFLAALAIFAHLINPREGWGFSGPDYLVLGVALAICVGLQVFSPWHSVALDREAVGIRRRDDLTSQSFSIPWAAIARIGLTREGDESRLVVWFQGVLLPAELSAVGPELEGYHDSGGFVVCQPVLGSGANGGERILEPLRAALRAHAGPRYVADPASERALTKAAD
ncbi:serine/threonine-protein kinase [Spirillospora sp. NPDC052269]